MTLLVHDLGFVSYERARQCQLEVLEECRTGARPQTLLLLEHPPVITLGRGSRPENLGPTGDIPVFASERGGDVTLHAPGQLVGYLIRRLPEGARDLHAHLRLLEEIVMRATAALGVGGSRRPPHTGVWVGPRKLASVGVACRSWCTWHGFALNVSIDLAQFRSIRPCGFDPGVMTSLARELGNAAPEMAAVKRAVADAATGLLMPEMLSSASSRTSNTKESFPR